MLSTRSLLGLAIPLFGAACTAPLRPDRAPVLSHRFALSVGGEAFGDYDTDVRLDSDNGKVGTDIDLEDDLGFDTSGRVLRLDAEARLADRHGLTLSFFQIERGATWSLDREISFGDKVFGIEAEVSSDLDLTVAKFAYRYFFLVRERMELAASLGLHTLDYDVSINAKQVDESEDGDALAPLPVLGLNGAYALGERTRISLTGEVFAIEFEGSKGSLVDARLTLDHDFGEHWGVGFGYNRFGLDLDVDRSRFDGELGWQYDGLLFYLRALF